MALYITFSLIPTAPVLLTPKGAIFVKPPRRSWDPQGRPYPGLIGQWRRKILRLEVGGPKYGNGNGHHGSGV